MNRETGPLSPVKAILPRWSKSAAKRALRSLGYGDRRLRFHDISALPASERRPRSHIIQFYSAVHNIGNYTPVLGIQEMLRLKPDTWNVHRVPVDFEFINRHYRAVIVGGAGLLYRVFEPFWRDLQQHCKLPMIVWGVGGCFPGGDEEPCVDRSVVRDVFLRCDLINLRDELTADYYGTCTPDISACPTIVWLDKYVRHVTAERNMVLFASHKDLVPRNDTDRIWEAITSTPRAAILTDNVQRRDWGLMDIIKHNYCKAHLVVTTRLHGAIIAFGLGVPYVGLVWDAKLRAFHEHFGNGILAGSVGQLPKLMGEMPTANAAKRMCECKRARQFGARATEWVQAHLM